MNGSTMPGAPRRAPRGTVRSPRSRRSRARTRTVLGTASAAVALLAGAMTVPSAQAAEPEGSTDTTAPRHCALDTRTGTEKCFSTFTEAVETASGGRIDDAPASARKAAKDSGFQAEAKSLGANRTAAAEGDIIQGTFFDDSQFGGDSLTVYGEALCEKDGWVDFQHDLEDGWKNRISSVQPWGDCWIWLYPEPNLGGDRDGPFKENTGDIGSLMNDRTQSIGFS
ncbi:hypothetical protein [Streptomyces daliensis]